MVKVIWQKDRIAATHGWFSGICQVATVCTPPIICFLGPIWVHNQNGISIGSPIFAQLMAECSWACLGMSFPQKLPLGMGRSGPHLIHGSMEAWTHPNPQPKRHLDQFSHFCTARCRETSGIPGHVLSHKNCTFAWGNLEPHLIRGSTGRPKSKFQMASRLVQQFFCKAHGRELLYFTMNRPFPHYNCLSHGGLWTPIYHMVPWVHPNHQPKRHLDWFSRFCTVHRRVSLYFTMSRPFSAQNCPSPKGDLDPI